MKSSNDYLDRIKIRSHLYLYCHLCSGIFLYEGNSTIPELCNVNVHIVVADGDHNFQKIMNTKVPDASLDLLL